MRQALLQVVTALSQKAGHVPYRSSKLTHYLKDSIGGNCRTLLVACAWSEVSLQLASDHCILGASLVITIDLLPEHDVVIVVIGEVA